MASESDIRDMAEGMRTVPTSAITFALNDAGIVVADDGIEEGHSHYDLLHKWYTMHLLQAWGWVEDIASEAVGDVNTSYFKSSSACGSKWEALYYKKLGDIQGLECRLQ